MLIDDEPLHDAPAANDADAAGPMPAADTAEVENLTREVLTGLGLELSVKARDTETSIEVDIEGADRELLIDRRGEALNALQYLLNRIVYRGRGGKKIHLDSGGYRRDREDEIVEIARRAAEAAKSRGKEQLLSPLNPYERRLVHLALAEIDGVTTRSVGDGFLKRVAVVPTGPGTKRSDR
jgi:spoIIIJ-associated protein